MDNKFYEFNHNRELITDVDKTKSAEELFNDLGYIKSTYSSSTCIIIKYTKEVKYHMDVMFNTSRTKSFYFEIHYDKKINVEACEKVIDKEMKKPSYTNSTNIVLELPAILKQVEELKELWEKELKENENYIKDCIETEATESLVISAHLSKDQIREYKDKLDWNLVSKYQILSEDFIREFQDKVNWEKIYRYQYLSESFKEEFKYKLEENKDDS